MDDDAILDLFAARAETAICETSHKYNGYCLKIAMNILQSKEDAEECVNDTFLRAWNSIPPERPVVFRAYLAKIVRNLSLDKFKQSTRKKRGGDSVTIMLSELEECLVSNSGVESEFDRGLMVQALNNFLEELDAENRLVFMRRYWYSDSIATIAEGCRMSESKVKSMLFRTRRKLKLYLKKEGLM